MDKPVDKLIDLSIVDKEVPTSLTEQKKSAPMRTKIPSSPPIKSARSIRTIESNNIYENVMPVATSISIQSFSSSSDEKTQILYPSGPESLRQPKRRTRSQRPTTRSHGYETGSQSEEEFEAAGLPNERQRLLTTKEFAPSLLNRHENGSKGSESLDFGGLSYDELVAGLPSKQPLHIKGQLNYII